MTTTTTRRAILASAASLPVLAMPAAAMAGPDPIFNAIERHRAAFGEYLFRCRLSGDCRMDAPEYVELEEATTAAIERDHNAAIGLVNTMPTTSAGIVALIAYVESFNSGGVALGDAPTTMRSQAINWPSCIDDEDDTDEPMFGFKLLSNVRAALEAMAVRS